MENLSILFMVINVLWHIYCICDIIFRKRNKEKIYYPLITIISLFLSIVIHIICILYLMKNK